MGVDDEMRGHRPDRARMPWRLELRGAPARTSAPTESTGPGHVCSTAATSPMMANVAITLPRVRALRRAGAESAAPYHCHTAELLPVAAPHRHRHHLRPRWRRVAEPWLWRRWRLWWRWRLRRGRRETVARRGAAPSTPAPRQNQVKSSPVNLSRVESSPSRVRVESSRV